MAGASWKGSIAFGPMLQFPVRASAVDRETKFSFNQHHGEAAVDPETGEVLDHICGGRIRQQPGACEACGRTVEKAGIVRGYNGTPGIDEEYLDSLEREKSAVMELDGLVPAEQIEPRWFQRSYDITPEKGAEKAYVLFLRVLERQKRVGIGKVVMGGKEHIVVVRPRSGVLAMELLWWPEELKSDAGARDAIAGVAVTDTEIKMGEQLGAMMARDFQPESYVNEYAESMRAYLESFASGAVPAEIEKRPLPSVAKSLEDALAASLAALGGEEAKPKPKKKAKAA